MCIGKDKKDRWDYISTRLEGGEMTLLWHGRGQTEAGHGARSPRYPAFSHSEGVWKEQLTFTERSLGPLLPSLGRLLASMWSISERICQGTTRRPLCPWGWGGVGQDIMSEEAVRSWVKKKPRTARRQGFKVLGAEEGLVVLHWCLQSAG